MLQNLTSLHFLKICNCPEVVSSPEVFLTPNLKFLVISECQNTKRPPSEWTDFSSHISQLSSCTYSFPEFEIHSLHGIQKPSLSGNSFVGGLPKAQVCCNKGRASTHACKASNQGLFYSKKEVSQRRRKRLAQGCLHPQCPNTWNYTTRR